MVAPRHQHLGSEFLIGRQLRDQRLHGRSYSEGAVISIALCSPNSVVAMDTRSGHNSWSLR